MQTEHKISRARRNEILLANAVTKWKLSQRDGERCNSCKNRYYTSDLTIDHVIPTCDGGADTLENKQLLCLNCHKEKTRKENTERTLRNPIPDPQIKNVPSSFSDEIIKNFINF